MIPDSKQKRDCAWTCSANSAAWLVFVLSYCCNCLGSGAERRLGAIAFGCHDVSNISPARHARVNLKGVGMHFFEARVSLCPFAHALARPKGKHLPCPGARRRFGRPGESIRCPLTPGFPDQTPKEESDRARFALHSPTTNMALGASCPENMIQPLSASINPRVDETC